MGKSRLFLFEEERPVVDKWLFGSVVLLICWGIFCIYSAASGGTGRGMEYARRQIGWAMVACVACWTILLVGYRRFMDWAYPIYVFTLLVLLLTLFLAPKVKGAQRSWVAFGFLRFQPSEFAKISLAMVLAKYLSRYPPLSLKTFLGGLAVASPAILLILAQPDLGSALVYVVITFAALFVAGAPLKYLAAIMGAAIGMLPFAWLFLKEYQKLRLLVFIDPARDPLGAGYNVIQSRIAVGSGGFWGKGFLQGLQSKLRFLPEAHTDFIFSVYAEEFGFWGTTLLLLIFGILFTRILTAGLKNRDIRGKILVAAIASWIWFHMFESIGMSMGLMPVTGIPLPFLSYGGSSLVAISIALGLAGSVHAGSSKPYKPL